MTLLNPCISSVGPRNARIVGVGEAPGEQEEFAGVPFIGPSGQELDRIFEQAGLARRDIYLTNVLWTRPPSNKLEAFCVKRAEVPPGYNLPPLSQGKYLHPDLIPEIERLHAELNDIRPNVIIAFGNTAAWAILGYGGISKIRGSVTESRFGKVLPTFHPAVLFHGRWDQRPIILADVTKARAESEFPEIHRPKRFILIDPTLEEVVSWSEEALNARLLSIDCETKKGTITELGFAYSHTEAIVIPFFDRRKYLPPYLGSYWLREEEIIVRKVIGRVLSSPIPKLFQNGLYDLQYLRREGYRKIRSCIEDSMILQHSLYPEMPKSLGFLGSIHTNDIAWKNLRPREDEELKRDD